MILLYTSRGIDPLVKLVKTPAFHAGNVSSNLARVISKGYLLLQVAFFYEFIIL